MIANWLIDPAVLSLATLMVKATLLLTAASLLDCLLRFGRASASVRHLVWSAAIGGLLVLPAFGTLPWHVDVLSIAADPIASTQWESSASDALSSVTASEEAGVSAGAGDAREQIPFDAGRATRSFETISARESLLALYLFGLTALLLRLAAGRWSLRRLTSRANQVSGEEWLSLLREIARQLDMGRPVRLLQSAEVGIPMTWGTRAPSILLPAEAASWSEERRRVVLLHEMAHIVRCDFLTQVAAGIACAVYWFHPLVWYASRRLRVEREIACDDHVLSAGTRPGSYVTHLLEVAHACGRPRTTPAAAISMARPSQLEGRMLAALDSLRSRRVVGKRGVLVTGMLAAVLTCLIGSLRAKTAEAATYGELVNAETPAIATSLTDSPSLAETENSPEPTTPPRSANQQRIVERTVQAVPGGRLTINLETGGTLKVVGWDRSTVSLRAVLRGRDWSDTRVDLSSTGKDAQLKSLQVGNNSSYSTSHRFELRVPSSYDVSVRSNGGSIEIRDVRGSFVGSTNGGPLHLTSVEGEARLSTNGGEITVTDARLDGYVKTNGGEVRFHNVRGNLRGSSNGGAVIRTNGEAAGASAEAPVNITRPGGAIDVESAPFGASLHTGGGRIYVRSAARFVNARTGGGEIVLHDVDGRVHASTGAGNVRVSLLDRRNAPHDVEIRSGTGAVELVLPSGFDADLDIETAYTNNLGHRVSITSDFPLRISESSAFESVAGGTPRKFVRGRARIGSGTHRVVVRTVNGDVVLRRAGNPISLGAPGTRTRAKGVGAGSRDNLELDCFGAVCKTTGAPTEDGGFAYVTGEGKERVGAIRALALAAPEKAAALALEKLAFSEPDAESALAAVRELEHLGDAGLAGLIRVAVAHSAGSARREAAGSLGRLACDDAVATLHRVAMSDSDPEVQREAVRKLAATYSRTDVVRTIKPAAIRDILRQIARLHPRPQVRAEAVHELGELSNG